jgi:hypothetical protein
MDSKKTYCIVSYIVNLYLIFVKDLDIISKFAESNRVKLEHIKFATSGWNWGDCTVDDGEISFKIGENIVFEIPLADVSQAARQSHSLYHFNVC